MKYLFLAIFIITTTIHLYASLKKNQKLRNYSKPWILLSLLGYYLCASQEIKIVVVLALIFSWIGDMFLILKGVKWFTVGGISFPSRSICLIDFWELLSKYLRYVELSIKSIVSYYHTIKYGSLCYLDDKLFINKANHMDFISKAKKEIGRSDELFIRHHINNKNSPMAKYENYIYDYENPLGSGRIAIE